MPKEIQDKVIWMFILLPGFLSTSIIGLIIDLGQLTEFQIIFYSLIFTLMNLAIVCSFYKVSDIFRRKSPNTSFSKAIFCLVIILVSVGSGILFGVAAEKDLFFVTLRNLPITNQLNKRSSSRPLTFLLSQNAVGQLKREGDARPMAKKKTEAWLKIRLKSGKHYEGWPEFFEIGNKPSELYLSPACEWVTMKGGQILEPIPGPGVIIYESEIETIVLTDREESSCYKYWFGLKTERSESTKSSASIQ